MTVLLLPMPYAPYCCIYSKGFENGLLQDAVPDDTSIIPTLLRANNKATGTPLSDM